MQYRQHVLDRDGTWPKDKTFVYFWMEPLHQDMILWMEPQCSDSSSTLGCKMFFLVARRLYVCVCVFREIGMCSMEHVLDLLLLLPVYTPSSMDTAFCMVKCEL